LLVIDRLSKIFLQRKPSAASLKVMAKFAPIEVILNDGTVILIRSATASDATRFIEFAAKAYRSSPYLVTEPDEFVPDLQRQQASLEEIEASESSIVLVALHQEQIIGNIEFRNQSRRRRISHRGSFGMSVDLQYRGKGLGKALLKSLIAWASQPHIKVEKIELGVLSENATAIRLYESLGFEREGLVRKAVKTREGRYLDEVQMGLFLSDTKLS
jgi:RimJ/RimL family protein N-acetyltransferase